MGYGGWGGMEEKCVWGYEEDILSSLPSFHHLFFFSSWTRFANDRFLNVCLPLFHHVCTPPKWTQTQRKLNTNWIDRILSQSGEKKSAILRKRLLSEENWGILKENGSFSFLLSFRPTKLRRDFLCMPTVCCFLSHQTCQIFPSHTHTCVCYVVFLYGMNPSEVGKDCNRQQRKREKMKRGD